MLLRSILFVVLLPAACFATETPMLFSDSYTLQNSLRAEAPFGRFTYPCSVRSRTTRGHVCTAALIDEKWAVTTAHCIDGSYCCSAGDDPLLYCGIHDINSIDPEEIFDTKAFVHPEWNGKTEDGFDIALLRLNHKSHLTLPRLSLYKECHLDLDFISLGWGTKKDGVSLMGFQMASLVDRIPDNECKMMYPEVDLKTHMFCAGSAGQESGKENEGGLLVYIQEGDKRGAKYDSSEGDVLVGIHSFSERTSSRHKPVIYTSLIHFLPWIETMLLDCSERGSCNHLLSKASVRAKAPSVVRSGEEAMDYPRPTRHLERFGYARSIKSAEDETSKENYDFVDESSQSSAAPSSEELDIFELLEEELDTDMYKASPSIEAGTPPTPLAEASAPATDEDIIDDLSEKSPEKLEEKAQGAILSKNCHYLDLVLAAGGDPNAVQVTSSSKDYLLHMAVQHNLSECVKILIEYGADPSPTDYYLRTPLHRVVYTQNTEIAQLLLDAGANLEAKAGKQRTPLIFGVVEDAQTIVKFFLEKGADSEATDSYGFTPLHIATNDNNYDMIKILLEGGADIDFKDGTGRTALHLAAKNDATDIAELLLAQGADIDARTNKGETPLGLATRYESIETLKVLIDHGADVNEIQSTGQTPLHYAARRGSKQAAEILLANGADKTTKDDNGQTAYDLICQKQCSEDSKEELRLLLDPNN